MEKSTFLFNMPNFITGIRTVIDLSGSSYKFNTSRTPEEADVRALISDWANVGNDIAGVMNEYGQESKSK